MIGLMTISHLTDSLAPLPETRIEREALALQKLNVFCLADDADWRTQSAWWQSCVATVTYIYSTLNRYDPTSFADSQAIIEFRQKLASEINKLQHAIAEGQCWQSDWRITESEAMAARECNLENITDIVATGSDGPEYAADARRQTAINGRRRFYQSRLYALRGKNAARLLICYTFYSGVDWEGIHTCMLTCVIIANPNVGSSYQKMALRFGGAFCGAILGAVIHATGHALAGQYCRIAICAGTDFPVGRIRIATSSERSSYIGTQMVVTFALATLENVFGPVYDLVEIRDRALGIIIGTVVSAVIYTFVWPESEARTLPQNWLARWVC